MKGSHASPPRDIAVLRLLHQAHAPQYESAHEDFAQLGVRLHEPAHILDRDGNDFAGFLHADANKACTAAQCAHFATEVAALQPHDRCLSAQPGAHDGDLSGQNGHDARVAFTRLSEHVSFARALPLSVAFETRQLRRGQLGEHLLPPRFIQARHGYRLRRAASTASKSARIPNETSTTLPLTKKPGVARTLLRMPLSMWARIRVTCA